MREQRGLKGELHACCPREHQADRPWKALLDRLEHSTAWTRTHASDERFVTPNDQLQRDRGSPRRGPSPVD